MNPRILLVIDERELRDWLRHHLDILWPDATVEDTLSVQFEGALRDLALRDIDLIVLSAICGDGEADPDTSLDLLRAALAARNCPPVVVIAAGGNELRAVEAMRAGAVDYLPRTLLNAQRLASALRGALRTQRRSVPAPVRAVKMARHSVDPAYIDLPQ